MSRFGRKRYRTAAKPKDAKSTFRVTVVEDEEVVRNLCLDIPESLGYEVVFARNGADGLRMFRENSDIIDLTFTDVVMPRLFGVEMARQIKELVGTTPVIFTT